MNNTIVLVVDVQKDFCEGGKLAAINTESLIIPLNSYLKEAELQGYFIAFTKDWHKISHMSFVTNGGIWPQHCIAGSVGAELHEDLYIPSVHMIINKGNEDNIEGYSAFDHTNLEKVLHKMCITEVIVCGIAASYCVAQTAISSAKLGFKTSIITNLTRDVISDELKIKSLWQSLQNNNVFIK